MTTQISIVKKAPITTDAALALATALLGSPVRLQGPDGDNGSGILIAEVKSRQIRTDLKEHGAFRLDSTQITIEAEMP